jgi:NAD(P)H dehydrogenase (quinone)
VGFAIASIIESHARPFELKANPLLHAIVLAHPRAKSFTRSAATAYVEAVREAGDEATIRDLYAMDFDPRLKASELPEENGVWPAADILAERAWLSDADILVFAYPFWFNAPPAILKGYVDRVFGLGFGYEIQLGGASGLLGAKRLLSLTTSGAPDDWIDSTGALETLQAGFDRHLCALTGLRLFDHVHLGGVVEGLRPDAAESLFDRVREAARRVCRAAAAP